MQPPESAAPSPEPARLEALRAWRSANAEAIVAAAWPMLQRLEEANKAWLLAEVGSLGGELALVLARMMPWRDIVGLESRVEWLSAAAAAAHSPTTPRLDFVRSNIRRAVPVGSAVSEPLRLPIHDDYASGIVTVGGLGTTPDPEALLAEMLRIVRPKGSLLLGEPCGGRWGGLLGGGAPKPLRSPDGFLEALVASQSGTLQSIGAERRGGIDWVLAKKAGA